MEEGDCTKPGTLAAANEDPNLSVVADVLTDLPQTLYKDIEDLVNLHDNLEPILSDDEHEAGEIASSDDELVAGEQNASPEGEATPAAGKRKGLGSNDLRRWLLQRRNMDGQTREIEMKGDRIDKLRREIREMWEILKKRKINEAEADGVDEDALCGEDLVDMEATEDDSTSAREVLATGNGAVTVIVRQTSPAKDGVPVKSAVSPSGVSISGTRSGSTSSSRSGSQPRSRPKRRTTSPPYSYRKPLITPRSRGRERSPKRRRSRSRSRSRGRSRSCSPDRRRMKRSPPNKRKMRSPRARRERTPFIEEIRRKLEMEKVSRLAEAEELEKISHIPLPGGHFPVQVPPESLNPAAHYFPLQNTTGPAAIPTDTGHPPPPPRLDADGRPIPIGPNGAHLPLDPSGRLFPHVITQQNLAIPVHLAADGVLRLPDLTAVRSCPAYSKPVNVDGTVIQLDAESKPLCWVPGQPVQPPTPPAPAVLPKSYHHNNIAIQPLPQSQTPGSAYYALPSDVKGIFLLANMERAKAAVDVYRKAVEKSAAREELGSNFGLTPSRSGVRTSTPFKSATKKLVKTQKPKDASGQTPILNDDMDMSTDEELLEDKSTLNQSLVHGLKMAINSPELQEEMIKGLVVLPAVHWRGETTPRHQEADSPLMRREKEHVLSFLPPTPVCISTPTIPFKFLVSVKQAKPEITLLDAYQRKKVFTFESSAQCDLVKDQLQEYRTKTQQLEESLRARENTHANLLEAYRLLQTEKTTSDLKLRQEINEKSHRISELQQILNDLPQKHQLQILQKSQEISSLFEAKRLLELQKGDMQQQLEKAKRDRELTDHLKAQLTAKENEIGLFTTERELLMAGKCKAEQDTEKYTKEITSLKKQIDSQQTVFQNLENQLQRTNSENAKLKSEKDVLLADKAKANCDIEKYTQEIKEKYNIIESHKSSTLSLEMQKAVKDKEMTELTAERNYLAAENTKSGQTIQKLMQEICSVELKLSTQNGLLEKHEALINQKDAELAAMQIQKEAEMRYAKDSNGQDIVELQNQLEEARARIEELEMASVDRKIVVKRDPELLAVEEDNAHLKSVVKELKDINIELECKVKELETRPSKNDLRRAVAEKEHVVKVAWQKTERKLLAQVREMGRKYENLLTDNAKLVCMISGGMANGPIGMQRPQPYRSYGPSHMQHDGLPPLMQQSDQRRNWQ